MVSCLITDVLLKTLCKFHLECDEIQSFLPHQQPLHVSSALGTSNNKTQIQSKISSSILKISSPSFKKKGPQKNMASKNTSKHPRFPSMVSPHQVYQPPRPRKWHRIHPKSTLTSLSALMPRKKTPVSWGGRATNGRPNFLAGRLNIYIYTEVSLI